ncbi:MAG: DNA-binding response regulator [Rubritepida sp.]|nr:DNA-binding response regulator [Rubritepida sp.]
MRILLIEDDESTAGYIAKGLREEGHVVDHANNGRDGLFLAMGEPFDVIVTDRMLPGPDGLSIIRALRLAQITTPVLVLTSLGEVEKRVEGLEAGADDYLAKPFAFAELRARIRALARRPSGPPAEQSVLSLADLRMDLLQRVAIRGARKLDLLPTEWRLLEYLMRHAGQVITRTMLLEKVWDFSFDPTTNVVDVHVSRLRRKLDLPGEPPMIRTVRGAGYALSTPDGVEEV